MINNLTEGKPLKLLFFFAVPMVVGNLFQQLYNMVDSMVVGRFVGEDALAAVGSSFPVVFLSVAVAAGLSMGCTVVISQFFGAGKIREMKVTVSTALISLGVIGLIIMGIGELTSFPLLKLLGTDPDIMTDSLAYLRIYFGGAVFLFLYNSLNGIYNALGDSQTPLKFLMVSALTNIVLDLLFVIKFHMGVAGVAWATLIAQGISAVFSLLIFLYRMRRYKSAFAWFDGRELRSMLQIAVPSVLQQSTVSIGMMIVQAVVNPFGTQALAGYAATMRVENVFSLIFVSIGNAVSPYVSQNLGAGKPQRIKKGYHAALVLDVCFAALAFLVIETLHMQISSLFLGKDGTALAYQVSGDYMRWLGYFFIFMGIKMATDGVLRGLGIMRPFLIANMVNLAIRLSVALICAPRFGIDFVWLAVPAGWFANFLVSYAALRKSWPMDKAVRAR